MAARPYVQNFNLSSFQAMESHGQAFDNWFVWPIVASSALTSKETVVNLNRISGRDWAPDCHNNSVATNLYNMSIRAVTVDNVTGEVFLGPWSHETIQPNPCSGKRKNPLL